MRSEAVRASSIVTDATPEAMAHMFRPLAKCILAPPAFTTPSPSKHTTSLPQRQTFVWHAVAELADSGKCAARSSHSPWQLVVGRSSSGQFILLQLWSVALQTSSSCYREVVFRSRQRLASGLNISMVSVRRPNGLWLVIWQRHRRREFEMLPPG